MGKTKVAIIDDSAQEENRESRIKNKASKKRAKATEVKSDAASRLFEPGEDGQKAQALTSVTPSEPIPPKAEGELEKQIQTNERVQPKKPQKPGKAKPRSKKYQEVVKDLDRTKSYPLGEAIELSKKLSYSKFTGTLEAHINTTQTGIRGLASLPYSSGKKLRILVFGKGAKDAGADLVGDDSTIEAISQGKIDFDLLISTPEWMPKLAKVARVLGPKGLMPNPKNGTITDDLKKAVEGFQAGKTEYKTEAKAAVIHLGLGKLNQPTEELSANVQTLLQTLGKTRVKKVTLSPTMGPSVKVDLASM
ncbi:50S ribosomal protein L1 [Candidatus Daviesbacteria bacterium]|nr:50S ribosomal protein L1 [Candidatus Daviesbacteria bacterium]